jgi:hypothetical protein
MINKRLFIWAFLLIIICSVAYADTYGSGSSFTPDLSNVTYILNTDITATYIAVGDWCFNVTGGSFAGNYCYNSTSPLNIIFGLTNIQLNLNNSFDISNESVISNYLYNLSLNVNYQAFNVDDITINVSCEDDGDIFNDDITDVDNFIYQYINIVNISGLDMQMCTFHTNMTDNNSVQTNATYDFYIGGVINVSGLNIYDNTTFGNFYGNYIGIDGTPLLSGTFNITGTSGFIENVSQGNYTINFTHNANQYFNQTFVIDVNDNLVGYTYNSSQAIVNIVARNLQTGELLTNLNVTIDNTITSTESNLFYNDNVTTVMTFYINASDYDYLVKQIIYDDASGNFTADYLDNLTIQVPLSFNVTFNLFDERTLGEFNISGPDVVNFLIFCTNVTYVTTINETTATIPVNCTYSKFRFGLEYTIDGEAVDYSRTFILSPDEANDINIYLIDLLTTTSLSTVFIIDDLLQAYENVSIYLKAILQPGIIQINADFADVEGKVTTFLIQNHDYLVEVHSSNLPTRSMGSYAASFEGEKTLRLYDIDTQPTDTSFKSTVLYGAGSTNRSGSLFLTAFYNDTANQTTSVTWNVRENSYNGPIIYTNTMNGPQSEFEFNASAYENNTLYSSLDIIHVEGTKLYSKLVYETTRIALDIIQYVGQDFLDWFFMIVLSVLAIMATIKTSNYVSIALIGFAALFVMFGWFTLSGGLLALSGIISLLMLLKKGDKNMS